MMEKEEWVKFHSNIEDILGAYAVAINLSNDDKDRVSVISRQNTDHYKSWAVRKKIQLNPNSDYRFDADCVTVSVDIFAEDELVITVDEQNCGIDMYSYPGLLMLEHKKSNPEASPGQGIYIFKTKDIDLLMLIIATLDKQVSSERVL